MHLRQSGQLPPHTPDGSRTVANIAVEPTPNSLRSCVASALGRGSPRALGRPNAGIGLGVPLATEVLHSRLIVEGYLRSEDNNEVRSHRRSPMSLLLSSSRTVEYPTLANAPDFPRKGRTMVLDSGAQVEAIRRFVGEQGTVGDLISRGAGPFFHYTDYNALTNIVMKNNLWLTDARFSNDAQELEHGRALISEEIAVLGEEPASQHLHPLAKDARTKLRRRSRSERKRRPSPFTYVASVRSRTS